jgi:hypothetical protein
MSDRSRRRWPACLAMAAALLLSTSLKLPLWGLRMEAPQYREEEALKVAVYPNAIRGDLNEIRVLNQYIGVHIPDQLPQLQWMPWALMAAAAAGLAATLLPAAVRSHAFAAIPVLLSLALGVAAAQAQQQMYEIGHQRDQKTKLVGVKDFTTPLLGTTRIAQFEVASRFGAGAYLVGIAVALQLAAAWFSRGRNRTGVASQRNGSREPTAQEQGRLKAELHATQVSPPQSGKRSPALSEQL